jgi:polyphosphate glucokinase
MFSALPLTAEIARRCWHVGFVPKPEISPRRYQPKSKPLDARAVRFSEPHRGYASSPGIDVSNGVKNAVFDIDDDFRFPPKRQTSSVPFGMSQTCRERPFATAPSTIRSYLAGIRKSCPQDKNVVFAERERTKDPAQMKILVVDVGGSHVKILATGQKQKREIVSGPRMTARQMVSGVRKLAQGWAYDVVSVGFPGPVLHDRPVAEPYNLGSGWLGFDFASAFGLPVRVINDAAMQALGSYRGGKMLFLGLGTGLGSAMIVDGIVEPMELGHLPYKKGTFEDYVGNLGLERFGKKRWRKLVEDVVERLVAALEPQDVVIGGGNVIHMNKLPRGCRASSNAHAFIGGFHMWDDPSRTIHRPRKKKRAFVSRKRRTRT